MPMHQDPLLVHVFQYTMSVIASQITGNPIVFPTVCPFVHQRTHQSSVSLAFARGIHRWQVDSPHKGQSRGKCFYLMTSSCIYNQEINYTFMVSQLKSFEGFPSQRASYAENVSMSCRCHDQGSFAPKRWSMSSSQGSIDRFKHILRWRLVESTGKQDLRKET